MNIYLPKPGDVLSEKHVLQWYSNIRAEFDEGILGLAEKAHMIANKTSESAFLLTWRRSFFRQHFVKTFTQAVSFLFAGSKRQPVILDLGCGMGTQSLAFAFLGARVVAMDVDAVALRIFEHRKEFYERQSLLKLDIEIVNSSAFDFDYSNIAPIDGLYSLFAFNLMQPSRQLVSRIAPCMSGSGRISILDGNCSCWVPRLLPWRRRQLLSLSPIEMEAELEKYNFDVMRHHGGIVLPPVLWCCLPYEWVGRLDSWLGCQSWGLPISHLMLARHR